MKILAIETSCDETAIAILDVKHSVFNILSNVVSSQVKLHAKWGGVVPGLAKREHQKNLPLVLKKALLQAGFKISNSPNYSNSPKKAPNSKSQIPNIDLIAVVNGPGLEPALWTGINFAEKLAKEWNKPLIPINHLEGHLFSVFLKKNRESTKHEARSTKSFEFRISDFGFPAVALLVSGGHTQLVLIKDWLKYKILGQTRDDAAGEAFDKVARMLDLGYPGGPAIAAEATKFEARNPKSETNSKYQILNTKYSLKLPRPMINDNSLTGKYDFSFSGLKTAVLYAIKKLHVTHYSLPITVICAEFQQAVIDVLISKTIRATKEYKAKTVIVAGGVAANKELRKQFRQKIKKEPLDTKYLIPNTKFTGDNAAMIALAAYFRYKNKKTSYSRTAGFKANGNLKIA